MGEVARHATIEEARGHGRADSKVKKNTKNNHHLGFEPSPRPRGRALNPASGLIHQVRYLVPTQLHHSLPADGLEELVRILVNELPPGTSSWVRPQKKKERRKKHGFEPSLPRPVTTTASINLRPPPTPCLTTVCLSLDPHPRPTDGAPRPPDCIPCTTTTRRILHV